MPRSVLRRGVKEIHESAVGLATRNLVEHFGHCAIPGLDRSLVSHLGHPTTTSTAGVAAARADIDREGGGGVHAPDKIEVFCC